MNYVFSETEVQAIRNALLFAINISAGDDVSEWLELVAKIDQAGSTKQ